MSYQIYRTQVCYEKSRLRPKKTPPVSGSSSFSKRISGAMEFRLEIIISSGSTRLQVIYFQNSCRNNLFLCIKCCNNYVLKGENYSREEPICGNTVFISLYVYQGFHQVWYQGTVKATVSGVVEDRKLKISEGSDQNWCFPESAQLAVSAKLRQLTGQTQENTSFGRSLLKF